MGAKPNVAPAPAPGTLFGKYRILSRLAIGGMAELFLAQPTKGERLVVLKRILPQLAVQTEFVSMFLDEARIAATLEHPNVVQVFDVGVERGSYFFTMEFVHGVDLRTLIYVALRQGLRLPLDVALHVIIELARGLDYAHEKHDFDGQPLNIIHRDVTPHNGLVSFDGDVKLADFGIAKASNRLNETRFGALKGKVGYMSPEQCTGQELDRRSDVYSLGIVLFEATVLRRLFRGKSDFAILKQIVEQPIPRPTSFEPNYPPELERILLRALSRDRAQRYPSAGAMADDLQRFAEASWLTLEKEQTRAFVRKVFAEQLASYEAARAAGKSLVQIVELLVPVQPPMDDSMFPTRSNTSGIKRAVAERAAMLQSLHGRPRTTGPITNGEGVRALDPNEFATLDTSGLRDAPDFQPAEGEATEPPPEPEPGRAPSTSSAGVAKAKARTERERETTDTDVLPTRSRQGLWIGGALAMAALVFAIVLVSGKPRTPSPPPNPTPSPNLNPTPSPPPNPTPSPNLNPPPTPSPTPTPTPTPPIAQQLDGKRPSKPTRAPLPAPPPVVAPKPRAPVGEGKLVLVTSPWVNVVIDGKARGQTPLSIDLPAGNHSVTLSNAEQGISRTLQIPIEANQTVRKRLDF